MDGDWAFDYVDSIEDMNILISTATPWFCDAVLAMCKAELERRKGILDELTAEAQKLGLGY